MGHNVGAAADRAVKNSERVKPAEMTREQWIAELRKNLKAGLFIPSHQTAALLDAHDELAEKLAAMQDDRDRLQKELNDAGDELEASRDNVTRLEAENIDLRLELKELSKAAVESVKVVDKIAGELFGVKILLPADALNAAVDQAVEKSAEELMVLGHLHPDVKTETDHKMLDPEASA